MPSPKSTMTLQEVSYCTAIGIQRNLRKLPCSLNLTKQYQQLNMSRLKISHIFIISLLVICFISGLYVFKVSHFTVTGETQSSRGWHDIETWSFVLTTGSSIIVLAIRPVDICAYLCDQDDDAKKGALQYCLWFYNKAKRKLRRARQTSWNRHLSLRTRLKTHWRKPDWSCPK